MADILREITDRIRADKAEVFSAFDPEGFALIDRPSPLGVPGGDDFFIIAECKKASPSKGLIQPDFRPADQARLYEEGGAGGISVLTEENYFLGSPDYLKAVKKAVRLPVLRKDFIIHPCQIYEAYNMGADFILLIAACLSDRELQEFRKTAADLGLGVLLEIHSEEEMRRSLPIEPDLLGINNRNLRTFETTIQTSLDLKKKLPAGQKVISESGIFTRTDISILRKAGFQGALIGESLMKDNDPVRKLQELLETAS